MGRERERHEQNQYERAREERHRQERARQRRDDAELQQFTASAAEVLTYGEALRTRVQEFVQASPQPIEDVAEDANNFRLQRQFCEAAGQSIPWGPSQ